MAEVLHSLFQKLPDIPLQDVQQTILKAMTTLGSQHPQETVEVVLSLCHPSERQVPPALLTLSCAGMRKEGRAGHPTRCTVTGQIPGGQLCSWAGVDASLPAYGPQANCVRHT